MISEIQTGIDMKGNLMSSTKQSMKTPSMYWGTTIFSNFDVRVSEKCQFLSDSKKDEF